jgi:hypothetical protein
MVGIVETSPACFPRDARMHDQDDIVTVDVVARP